jgi:hypothetical protein
MYCYKTAVDPFLQITCTVTRRQWIHSFRLHVLLQGFDGSILSDYIYCYKTTVDPFFQITCTVSKHWRIHSFKLHILLQDTSGSILSDYSYISTVTRQRRLSDHVSYSTLAAPFATTTFQRRAPKLFIFKISYLLFEFIRPHSV